MLLFESTQELFCYFWIHTAFVPGDILELTKRHIDGAWIDKECRIFHEGFKIVLEFADKGTIVHPSVKIQPPSFRIIERARLMRQREGFACEASYIEPVTNVDQDPAR